jgi:hypothetical protein
MVFYYPYNNYYNTAYRYHTIATNFNNIGTSLSLLPSYYYTIHNNLLRNKLDIKSTKKLGRKKHGKYSKKKYMK